MFFFYFLLKRRFNKDKTIHGKFKDYLVATDEASDFVNKSFYLIFDDFSGNFTGYDHCGFPYPYGSFNHIAGILAHLNNNNLMAAFLLLFSFFVLALFLYCCHFFDVVYNRRTKLTIIIIGFYPTRKFLEFLDYIS